MIDLRKAAEMAQILLNTVENIPPFHKERTRVLHALRAALAEPVVESFNKGLFVDLIAQHEGLAEELAAMDAEPEPTCKPALQVPSHKPTGWVGHRDQYAVPVLFNPYTGEPRNVRDVHSDPQGILIVPPGKVEMVATLAEPEQEPVAIGAEWIPCMKLPVVVHVRNQRPSENHVSTREGITPVKPDDLIMRGVLGEEYPIGRAIFEQTYTFDVKVNTYSATPLSVTKIRELVDEIDEGQEPSEYLVSLVRAIEQSHRIGVKK